MLNPSIASVTIMQSFSERFWNHHFFNVPGFIVYIPLRICYSHLFQILYVSKCTSQLDIFLWLIKNDLWNTESLSITHSPKISSFWLHVLIQTDRVTCLEFPQESASPWDGSGRRLFGTVGPDWLQTGNRMKCYRNFSITFRTCCRANFAGG